MNDRPKILVVGAGVVGTSTALALHESGADVTVVAAGAPGTGASAANAGLLVPADSIVWPGPCNRCEVPRTLLGRGETGIAVSWGNPAVLGWGLRFLLRSTKGQYERSSSTAYRLSTYSLQVLAAWADRYRFDFDLELNGMIFLYRDETARTSGLDAREPLLRAGVSYHKFGGGDLASIDSAYASTMPWVSLYTESAGHGDSSAFCRAALKHLQADGVQVLTGQQVLEVACSSGRAVGVRTSSATVSADHVVLAAGTGTGRLAGRAGHRAHILPVKGIATTVPIEVEYDTMIPAVGGVLEDAHVAFSRTKTHLRLTTGAGIGNDDPSVDTPSRVYLRGAGEALFPQGLDWSSARFEAGFRPMTPHGLPLIGPTKVPGLWLNSGHGALGWTQAAGSGALLAALITGSRPPLDPTPFQPSQRTYRSTHESIHKIKEQAR